MHYSPSQDGRAKRDAERVRSKAFWRHMLRTLRRLPNELMPFDAVRHLHPKSESYGGVQAIPIKQIVGSVDRYRDFDHYFLPRFNRPLNKWVGVRRAKLEGKELPAIEVYKVGDLYFVKDGHHRVSVARNEGQFFIDAEIIELNVTVQPDADDSIKDLIIKGEWADFLEQTRLSELRPDHYEIRFSITGRYDVLLEHVRTHQYYLGQENHRAFAWEEAVMSWYDRFYAPVVADMREHDTLHRFPGRTEADLYIWIMDHRYYISERLGSDIADEKAAEDYSVNYAPPAVKRVLQRMKQSLWDSH